MNDKIKISLGNESHEFPLVKGTENEIGIDIKDLRSRTGLITFDPGYKNTGSCLSDITYLDGEKGILRYRGYSIDDLANNVTFLEVAYLLIWGELPNEKELSNVSNEIQESSSIDKDLEYILKSFPSKAHPMGILCSLTSALIAFNPSSVDVSSKEKMFRATRINGKISNFSFMGSQKSKWFTH